MAGILDEIEGEPEGETLMSYFDWDEYRKHIVDPNFVEPAMRLFESQEGLSLLGMIGDVVRAGGRTLEDLARGIEGPLPDDPYPLGRSEEEILDLTSFDPQKALYSAGGAGLLATMAGEEDNQRKRKEELGLLGQF